MKNLKKMVALTLWTVFVAGGVVFADAAADKAQVAAAQANVEHYNAMIGFEKVVAPFAGTITSRLVNVGDYVTSAGGDDPDRRASCRLRPQSRR